MQDRELRMVCKRCDTLLNLFTIRCGIIRSIEDMWTGGIWMYFWCPGCGKKYQIDWITLDGISDWYPLEQEISMDELSRKEVKK